MTATGWSPWLIPVLSAVAVLCLLLRRRFPRGLTLGVFSLSVSSAVALGVVRVDVPPGGPAQDIALLCGMLCLVWASIVGVLPIVVSWSSPRSEWMTRLRALACVMALLFGVVTAIVQALLLTMRGILVAIDVLHCYPESSRWTIGFTAGGLYSLSCLVAASGIAAWSLRDRRLAVCLFGSTALLASWLCLLIAPLGRTLAGGYERKATTLVLGGAIAIVFSVTVMATGWLDRRRRWRLASLNPDHLTDESTAWPGLTSSSVLTAFVVLFLTSFHLAVPLSVGTWGGFRLASLITAGTAGLAATASFALLNRKWSVPLAELALALTSLSICGVVMLWLPSKPEALTERYPMVFNATLVGLAIATALWTWLAQIWDQQLDEGRAWTIAARLVPVVKRFSFLTVALALVVGAIMAVWPRLPSIYTADDTFGRVCAGFAGNLFLVLVTMWVSRHRRRFTFVLLTCMAMVSTVGFLVVRLLPFTSQYG